MRAACGVWWIVLIAVACGGEAGLVRLGIDGCPAQLAAAEKPEPTATEAPAAARGASDPKWGELISTATLEIEAAEIQARLIAGTLGASQYNAHYKELQRDAAALAALAEIATVHPDRVKWHAQAAPVRDLAARVSDAASQGLGAAHYMSTQAAVQELGQALQGKLPSNLPQAAEHRPFAEFAKRGRLMGHMHRSFAGLKNNVRTEEQFRDRSAAAVREASLLTALEQAIAAPGYGSADEAEYQKLAAEAIRASRALARAAQDQDFAAFTAALNRNIKACDQCHVAYRFADGD